jgi:predicted lactoylglutathione lyase
MDEEALTTSIRKFLKTVGVNSQREIEQALARATEQGGLAGTTGLPVAMTLEIPALKLQVRFDGELKLQ